MSAPPAMAALGSGVGLEDFVGYMPTHGYVYLPTMEMWAAASVDARIEWIEYSGPDGKPVRTKACGSQKISPSSR